MKAFIFRSSSAVKIVRYEVLNNNQYDFTNLSADCQIEESKLTKCTFGLFVCVAMSL